MRTAGLFLLVILASCSSPDSIRKRISDSRRLARSQPEEALRRIAPILEAQPENVEAHVILATAYQKLGQLEMAAEAWDFVIRVRVKKSRRLLSRAHRELARVNEQILASLPHRVSEPPQGELRARIVATLRSWSVLLEESSSDREARLGKARCQYRLGMHRRAHTVANQLLARNRRDAQALYLATLALENLEGANP